MINYFKDIVSDFPDELKQVNTPAGVHLFDVNENPTLLDKTKADLFHQIVAKILWGSLRCRPDLMLALSFLTSRVQYPDTDDWKKLNRLVSYINSTIDLKLRLTADSAGVIKWWVDTSFATRNGMRSQTGACMSMGGGAALSISKMQKLTTKSSTKAELVGVDDVMPQVIWTRNFLLAQGYDIKNNIVYQDNKSAILLETNGIGSSSKRTRHINIRFFFVADRIKAGELQVEFCGTNSN